MSRLEKKKEKAIREQWEKLNDSKSGPVKESEKASFRSGQTMNEWFFAVTERGVRISGSMSQKKAEYFTQQIG